MQALLPLHCMDADAQYGQGAKTAMTYDDAINELSQGNKDRTLTARHITLLEHSFWRSVFQPYLEMVFLNALTRMADRGELFEG